MALLQKNVGWELETYETETAEVAFDECEVTFQMA